MPVILEGKTEEQLIHPKYLLVGELAIIVKWGHENSNQYLGHIVIRCPNGDLMQVDGGPDSYWKHWCVQSLEDNRCLVRRLQPGEKVVVTK